jgi:hypothetical protein
MDEDIVSFTGKEVGRRRDPGEEVPSLDHETTA